MTRTAGTATAVHKGMTGGSQAKQDAAYAQGQADLQEQQQATETQAQLADLQAQVEAQQAAPAAATAGDDLMTELSKLSDMKNAGILSEEEFTAAKAKLLA